MSEDLSKERLLGLYYEMVKIRVCEERFAQAYAGGLIHGACHTYVGEEAIAVGVFGSPTYVVDGELFWGQDRLDLLARCLGVTP